MKSRSIFKALALTLAIVLCVGAMPTVSFAATEVDSGTDGTISWSLDDEGTLTISGTGDMKTHPWTTNHKDDILKVVIEDGVTSIGDHAFDSCTGLTSVTIPSSVTSIGYMAFVNCSNLTSVTISEGVTSIGGSAFDYCKNLTAVTLPDSIKNIGSYAFYHLITIYVSADFDTDLLSAYADKVVVTETNLTSPGSQTVTLNATIAAATFKVTVPTFITAAVDSDGNVVTAMNTEIKNYSTGPVEVTKVTVSGINDWTLVAYDTNFKDAKVDSQQFGMNINNVDVTKSGVAATFGAISGDDSAALNYSITTNASSKAVQDTIAQVVFTIGWYK